MNANLDIINLQIDKHKELIKFAMQILPNEIQKIKVRK